MGLFKRVLSKVARYAAGVFVGITLVSSMGLIGGGLASLGMSGLFSARDEPELAVGVMAGLVYKASWVGVATGAVSLAMAPKKSWDGLHIPGMCC